MLYSSPGLNCYSNASVEQRSDSNAELSSQGSDSIPGLTSSSGSSGSLSSIGSGGSTDSEIMNATSNGNSLSLLGRRFGNLMASESDSLTASYEEMRDAVQAVQAPSRIVAPDPGEDVSAGCRPEE